MVERLNTTVTGCKPVYSCVCDLSQCVEPSIQCEEPFVPTTVSTSCCNEKKCQCPDVCPPGSVKGLDETFECDVVSIIIINTFDLKLYLQVKLMI